MEISGANARVSCIVIVMESGKLLWPFEDGGKRAMKSLFGARILQLLPRTSDLVV